MNFQRLRYLEVSVFNVRKAAKSVEMEIEDDRVLIMLDWLIRNTATKVRGNRVCSRNLHIHLIMRSSQPHATVEFTSLMRTQVHGTGDHNAVWTNSCRKQSENLISTVDWAPKLPTRQPYSSTDDTRLLYSQLLSWRCSLWFCRNSSNLSVPSWHAKCILIFSGVTLWSWRHRVQPNVSLHPMHDSGQENGRSRLREAYLATTGKTMLCGPHGKRTKILLSLE